MKPIYADNRALQCYNLELIMSNELFRVKVYSVSLSGVGGAIAYLSSPFFHLPLLLCPKCAQDFLATGRAYVRGTPVACQMLDWKVVWACPHTPVTLQEWAQAVLGGGSVLFDAEDVWYIRGRLINAPNKVSGNGASRLLFQPRWRVAEVGVYPGRGTNRRAAGGIVP